MKAGIVPEGRFLPPDRNEHPAEARTACAVGGGEPPSPDSESFDVEHDHTASECAVARPQGFPELVSVDLSGSALFSSKENLDAAPAGERPDAVPAA